MKRIVIFLHIIILIWSCDKAKDENTKNLQESNKEAIAARDSLTLGVTLHLQPRHFTVAQLKDRALLTMVNNSKEAILTGDNYHIERLNEGKWEMLEVFRELAFNSIGYIIATGESKEFEIGFLADKQHYPPGKYRVGKYYMNDADTAPKASYNLYFEFEVTP